MDLGFVVMIAVLLLMPVAIFITGAIGAALLGALLNNDVEASNEGSELAEIW